MIKANVQNTKFIMLVGLAGSGKSTYATKLCTKINNMYHVSSDNIREELFANRQHQGQNGLVFETCCKKAIEYLKNSNSVVFDATNLRLKNRRNILSNIKTHTKNVKFECHVILTPCDLCIEQDSQREYSVSGDTIKKHRANFQIPFLEEGWNEINLIPPDGYFVGDSSNAITYFCENVHDFTQHNLHHSLTLLQHSTKCSDIMEDLLFDKYEQPIEYGELLKLMRAAFLHDYGKLYSHTVDEKGIWHYKNHAEIGSYMFLENCLRKETDTDINYQKVSERNDLLETLFYINYHMLPFDWKNENTKDKYRNIFGIAKFDNLMLLHKADLMSCK